MAPAPLIAVTSSEMRASLAPGTPNADPPRDEMVLGLRYLQALAGTGCPPVVVPPLHLELVEAFLDRLDGVCLSGGPDLSPAAYGELPHPRLGPTGPDLDGFELAGHRPAHLLAGRGRCLSRWAAARQRSPHPEPADVLDHRRQAAFRAGDPHRQCLRHAGGAPAGCGSTSRSSPAAPTVCCGVRSSG